METYFAQLVSLAFIFLLMGFASLGNLFTNFSYYAARYVDRASFATAQHSSPNHQP